MVKQRISLPVVVVAMLLLFAPPVRADNYWRSIVSQLSQTHHVVVDPGASPQLPNPEAINQQIMQTGAPIWVVNIAKSQTDRAAFDNANLATDPVHNALFDSHSPVTNPITVDGQTRRPPMIILVIDATGYHAWSYDVAQSVADATRPNIISAAASHRGDLNGAVSAFVSLMVNTPNTGPAVANVAPPPPPAQPTNWAFAWGLLWTFCALIMAGIGVVAGRSVYQSRQAKAKRRRDVNDRIKSAEYDVSRLAEEVLKGKDISAAQNLADSALANARTSFNGGDIDDAESHVKVAERAITDAYTQLTPERFIVEHVTAAKEVSKKKRQKATITARSPKGNTVTISNSDYTPRATVGYRNYYRGGVYHDVYFNPGYYPYPFWTSGWNWMNVMLIDELLNTPTASDYGWHRQGASSGGGSAAVSSPSSGHHSSGGSSSYSPSHHHSDYSGGSSSGGSTSFGGFSGGFSGGSSGGGSAGF